MWFTVIDQVLAKHSTPEENQAIAEARSNFDLYADKGMKMKEMLEKVGFDGVKIWEQPINILFRSGQEYFANFACSKLDVFAKSKNLSIEEAKAIEKEIIDMFD